MDIFDYIKDKLNKFNDSVRDELRQKKLESTGKAAQSLQVIEKKPLIKSTGISYLEYLNRGRAPGRFPPMDVIEKWVDIKGINVHPYVIARSIAKNGTAIFRDRTKGIMIEEKIDKLQKEINEDLPTFISNEIKTMLNEAFRKK